MGFKTNMIDNVMTLVRYVEEPGTTNVVVPKGIEIIADGAFEECESVENVTLPHGVREIGKYAFANCRSLRSVSLPETLTYISNMAFCRCASLVSVTIPHSVISIGCDVFSGCVNLSEIKALSEEAVPMIDSIADTKWYKDYKGDYVILGSWLIEYRGDSERITIPEGVTQICPRIYRNNDRINSVEIPYSVRLIGFEAFSRCSSLERLILPGAELVGDGAFLGCTSLKEVTMYEGVKQIGYGAFKGCRSLKKITIPDSVTEIMPSAFDGCDSLDEIIMSDGIRRMFEKSLSKNTAFYITIAQSENLN